MATNPTTHPDIYQPITVNGTNSPGKVTLSGYSRTQEWEQSKPKGSTGTSTLNRGAKNNGFTASFFLADEEDQAAWDDFQKMLDDSVSGPKPRALLIFHPDLLRLRKVDFVLESIGEMQHDGKGGCTVVCKFLDYSPPRPKPPAKAEAGGRSSATDPNAARKRELAALLEQAKKP